MYSKASLNNWSEVEARFAPVSPCGACLSGDIDCNLAAKWSEDDVTPIWLSEEVSIGRDEAVATRGCDDGEVKVAAVD